MITSPEAENTAAKQRRGRPFQPGRSGNPAGKPKGTRHHATKLGEQLLESGIKDVAAKVLAMAKEGDLTACRIIIERLIPVRRERTLLFEMPALSEAADVTKAYDQLIQAIAHGQVTPGEAQTLAAILDGWRRSYETLALEQRLAALERGRN